jgi:hypothetical protein
MLKPPYFDYSIGIDIERDFTYQLRTELTNKKNKDVLAYGHRMEHYQDLILDVSPRTLASTDAPNLVPISYTLKMQRSLCPARLGFSDR